MYSPLEGLRSLSRERPSYSEETSYVSRQFSSQDDTPRALPRTASHHTRSFSNSYSFDRSNDAFFSDRNNTSNKIARRMSESISRDKLNDLSRGNISHGKSCDICTDNTPCNICNQNAKAVDHNAGLDISGSYSRTFPSYALWSDASHTHRRSDDVSRDVNSHDATCKICSESASDSSRNVAHDISEKASYEGFRELPRSEYDAWNRHSHRPHELSYDLSQILIGDESHDHSHEGGKDSPLVAEHSHSTAGSTSHQASKGGFDNKNHVLDDRSDGSRHSFSAYSLNDTHNVGSHVPSNSHDGGPGVSRDSSNQQSTGKNTTKDSSQKHYTSRGVPEHSSYEVDDGRGDSIQASHKLFLDNISERSHHIDPDESSHQHEALRNENRKVAFDTADDTRGTCYHGYKDLTDSSRGIPRSEQAHNNGGHESCRHERMGSNHRPGTVITGLLRQTSNSSENRSQTKHHGHISNNLPPHHTHIPHDDSNNNQNNTSSHEHNAGGGGIYGQTGLFKGGSHINHYNTTRDDRSGHNDISSNSSHSRHDGHHEGISKNCSSSENEQQNERYHNKYLSKGPEHTKTTNKITSSRQNQQIGGSSQVIYDDGQTSESFKNDGNLKPERSDKTGRDRKPKDSQKTGHSDQTEHINTTEHQHKKEGNHDTERDGSSGQTHLSTGKPSRTSMDLRGHSGFVDGDEVSEKGISRNPTPSGNNDGGENDGHSSHIIVHDQTSRSGQTDLRGGGLSSHPHTYHTLGQEPPLPGESSQGPPPRPPRQTPPQGPPFQGPLPPPQPALPGPSAQVPRLHSEKDRYIDGSRTNSSNGHTDEPPSEHRRVPKSITRHGWRRYFHFSGWLIHIPAIVLTAILLWFTSRERFWYRVEGPRSVNLTPQGVEVLLLVLVKIWEVLVVLSLSAMAISMLRRRLIGGGVRLGFLTGGYRVGDFRYLFSLPFWRHGMFSFAFWETMMVLLFIFATLITIILIPAAGALLLPSLQWFPMDHARAFGNVSTPLLYQTQASQVWPTLFTDSAPWNNTSGCTEVEGIYNAACPAGGFTEIWNWAGGFATTGLSNQVTFSDSSTNLRRQLLIAEMTDSGVQDPPILSTTPSHHLSINFGLVKSYINNANVNSKDGDMGGEYPYRLSTRRVDSENPSNLQTSNPIFQPFVQSKCHVASKAEILATNGSLNYPVSSLNCFGDSACLQAQGASPPRAINASQWDTPECQGQLITTNVFAYQNGTPILQMAGQLPDPGGDHTQDRLFACNFLASWVAAEVSTDSSECDAMVSGLNNPHAMVSTFQKQSFEDPAEGYVMKFDASWFQYLSPVSFASSVTVNGSKALKYYSATESFVRHFAVAEDSGNSTASSRYSAVNNSTFGSAQAETFLGKVFGVYLTDAISRTGSESLTLVRSGSAAQVVVSTNSQYSEASGSLVNETSDFTTGSFVLSRQAPEGTVSDSMGFDFSVERYGWGTGKPSTELSFGKAVLYIYLAVLILYLLTVVLGILLELVGRWPSMHVPSVVPWWDLQELFVLALKTSPPRDRDLADAGAGVTSSRVWRKRIRAMADAHHNVELVLNDGTLRGELSKTGTQRYF